MDKVQENYIFNLYSLFNLSDLSIEEEKTRGFVTISEFTNHKLYNRPAVMDAIAQVIEHNEAHPDPDVDRIVAEIREYEGIYEEDGTVKPLLSNPFLLLPASRFEEEEKEEDTQELNPQMRWVFTSKMAELIAARLQAGRKVIYLSEK